MKEYYSRINKFARYTVKCPFESCFYVLQEEDLAHALPDVSIEEKAPLKEEKVPQTPTRICQ